MSEEVTPSLTDRLARFQELREKREKAAALNLASTKIEDAELRQDPRNQARLLRKQAKAQKYLAKQAAKEEGVDLDRQNNLTYTIEETQQWNEKLAAKEARKDVGFTDFTQLTRRKYEKLTDKLDTSAILRRSKEEAKEAMAEEIVEDQKQRLKRSRRRRFDETEEVTFINERNARFNKKASRAYDEYTEELRESLERGTAL
jgi:pre-mRNA-splicing factor SYF2